MLKVDVVGDVRNLRTKAHSLELVLKASEKRVGLNDLLLNNLAIIFVINSTLVLAWLTFIGVIVVSK